MNSLVSTFGLLGLSILCVWLPPIRLNNQFSAPPWTLVFFLGLACGLAFGYLLPSALFSITALMLFAWLARRKNVRRWQAILFGGLTGLLGLALALHRMPGFNNPSLIADVRFSADALAFTQYANFDKGFAGLILLLCFCPRIQRWKELPGLLKRIVPILCTTIVIAMTWAMALDLVKPDIKLPAYTPIFLIVNLLFTCIAEEAFFRGFVQDRLVLLFNPTPQSTWFAILGSAGLFGLAHFAGGIAYAVVAGIAGVGYAYAYAITRRIEAAILIHFSLNAVHFIGFTYPKIL